MKLIKNALAIQDHPKADSIVLDGNIIKFIGKEADCKHYSFSQIYDAKYCVVCAGFINTHHHFFQALTRATSKALNMKLFDWLTLHYGIWKNIDEKSFYYSSLAAMGELMLSGATTISNHSYLFSPKMQKHPLRTEIQAAKDIGCRFVANRGFMSMGKSKGGLPPDDVIENIDDVIKDTEDLLSEYTQDKNDFSMIKIVVAPCSPFNVDMQDFIQSKELARKYKVSLHTHLAETKDEEVYCIKKYNKRPLELCADLDWLGNDVWFAHGIHFNDDEIKLLAQTGTGISHCPQSNMRLGSGVCRVLDLLKAGVNVSLAVDGSASNDSGNMLLEMKFALYMQRLINGADSLNINDIYNMATIHGANVLGLKNIGKIQVNNAADLAIFDLNSIEYTGIGDPFAALIMCNGMKRAKRVYINGEVVVDDGQLNKINEADICKNCL